jgi:uncharacterized membrane protein YphA (DoxX/SURF4 family)
MNASRYLPFIGRLFIGLPFTVSGLSKLAAYGATIALIASSKLPLPLAVDAAAKAFPAWSQSTPAERARLFLKAAGESR